MPVAIITGGSRGFGRALAVDLAKDGWDLVVDGRRGRPLDDLGRELEGLGANVTCIVGDVADPDHRAALVEAAARRSARWIFSSTTPARSARARCRPSRRTPSTP